ncbi:MAG: acetoin:2,6-dichlorophenolindophenol oxidoreductase subunit alpha, partial [Chloroflexota bacterium]|nr:acetoin:2,6-dichlorophenolindophenol oxidoreductase subunit alpha [Chloroflexota bacterium]
GAVFETFNLASLWSLPVLYVCENNAPGPYTPRRSGLVMTELSDLARTLDIRSVAVDTSDPTAAFDAAVALADWVRTERKPGFLEARTVIWPSRGGGGDEGGPSLAATGPTVIDRAWDTPSDGPLAEWFASDPVLQMARLVLREEVADRAEISTLDEAVSEQVVRAVQAARSAPWPEPQAAFADVFVGSDLWPH